MKDHLIVCPLCHYEIPFDSSKCTYCGALLAPGPARGTPILKGIVCSACSARNYNYDSCDACGHKFTKTCINCGGEMPISEPACAHCGHSGRRPTSGGRRGQAEIDDDTTPSRPAWMTYAIPAGISLVIVLFALVYAMWPRADAVDGAKIELGPQPGEARAVDTDGDGTPDYWDVYGQNERVSERRHDVNHDSIIEKIEFFDSEGNPKYAHVDADGDGDIEQVHAFNKEGQRTMVYHYEGESLDVPRRIERYSAAGDLIERWNDKNLDGVWDVYQRYDKQGNLLVEGADTKESGFIDLYLVYKRDREIMRREYDENGDGFIEKRETLNPQGIRVVMEEDTDANGVIDKKTFFHLTGKTRWVQLDSNGDAIYDTFKSYTKEGRLARTGIDNNLDGSPDNWK
jgi:hypothetical protein